MSDSPYWLLSFDLRPDLAAHDELADNSWTFWWWVLSLARLLIPFIGMDATLAAAAGDALPH